MVATLNLPIIDLSSPNRLSTANSIRQACTEYGFFYLVNHGVDEEFLKQVFDNSADFFSLPLQHKMNLARKEYRGYTPLYAENLDPTSLLNSRGDPKESYYIATLADPNRVHLNQWPSEESVPNFRPTVESLYWKLVSAGNKLLSLIALSLNLDEDYFDNISDSNKQEAFLRLLRYPGKLGSNEELYGASPHSDYGMITLLLTNGVPGLQICKEKLKQPQVWCVGGCVSCGGGLNCEHWRHDGEVDKLCIPINTSQSDANRKRTLLSFYLDPPSDCVVKCFESCCSEASPPRFPSVRSGDYLNERFRVIYGSEKDLKCSIQSKELKALRTCMGYK